MPYETIEADIVEHVAANGGVLIHQVNCQQVAGRGLALQIRNKWPAWYQHYRNTTAILGWCDIFPIARPTWPNILIVSLYAQAGYRAGTRQTDYNAFKSALRIFTAHIAHTNTEPQRWAINHGGIYVPMGIGCGLGGGDWNEIEHLLVTGMPANFTLCKLPA